ncbi:RagB/SusD family nutrient uptake outer membrane protein [Dyadobacter chenhuakuii]|uniref:RagB/SusD family nutrient uptake outer membrane protein n=1 Tax=Dyadobacter chenhuakuii TaxID=2909339 RepID=A0A9X1U041_9BACT|nr:RagB/SusD family nutrient uptake outer membrane protein [Dyadobacter chenhuakuii]MCF2497906.1 RagB/SusD family nutrient uptake outer membrane protein [Dyadobacter chenhuakuii]
MKKYIQLLLAAGLLTVVSGCNDEFLDRVPQTEISKDKYFNSEQDLETYILGLYDFGGTGIYVDDASTDNAATTGATEIKSIMVGNPSSATVNAGWDWTALRNINFFLDNFRKAPISEEALNHYEGLARFFRARFYMEKVKRYSNVPWYDHVLATNDEALNKPQDNREFVIGKIFEDYAFAAQHVRDDNRSGAVNNATVLTYQARHALYEGTFRKYHSELNLQASANGFLQIARDAAKKVIDSGDYSVHSTGKPMEDYASLFNNTSLESNKEVILGTFNEQDKINSGWWGAFMFGNYEASPARDLLQTYLMKDGTPFTSQAGYAVKLFTEEFKNRDPRLYQTFAYPGWELVNATTYSQGAGIYIQQFAKNQSGYHQLKGFVNQKEVAVANSLDTPLLRYAEVLLTYAEAKAELNELTQADLDLSVNKVRARAGMPKLTLNATADATLKSQYPSATSSTLGALLEIRRERRVELAMEGFRYDDLMRWNAGKLIEKEPEGLYFPSLGNYDLTGDGVMDVKLIPVSSAIPAEANKESNSLGKKLIYYRVGPVGSDASFFLKNGTSGTIVTDPERGTFQEPKYYYRPVPKSQVTLNPNLKQYFGWE